MKKLLINFIFIMVVAIPTTTLTSTNKRYSSYCVAQLEQQRQIASAQRAAFVQENSQRNEIRTKNFLQGNQAHPTINIIDTSDRTLMDTMSDISDDEEKVVQLQKRLISPFEMLNNNRFQHSKSYNPEQSCPPISLSEQSIRNNNSYLVEHNRQALAQTRAIYAPNQPQKKDKTNRKSPTSVISTQNNENCLNQASSTKFELSERGKYMQKVLNMNFQDRYNNTPDQDKHNYFQSLVHSRYVVSNQK